MKALGFGFFLIFSLSSFAQGLHVYENLKKLNRVITFEVDGVKHKAGFLTAGGMDAYFTGLEYDAGGDFRLHITGEYDKPDMKVEILSVSDETLITFSLVAGTFTGVVEGDKAQIEVGHQSLLYTDGNRDYWAKYKVKKNLGKVRLTLKTPFNGASAINAPFKVTSPMEFLGCDGCEHGDQLLVGKVNVFQSKSFGKYYVEDCGGTVLPLLEQLLSNTDHKVLNVPFTFKGLINMDTTDLLEEIGNLWVGTDEGQVFVGPTTKLPVSSFLDSLIVRAAVILKTESHKIWKDATQNGKFTSYQNDVLTFQYKNAVIKTNLKTATTL